MRLLVRHGREVRRCQPQKNKCCHVTFHRPLYLHEKESMPRLPGWLLGSHFHVWHDHGLRRHRLAIIVVESKPLRQRPDPIECLRAWRLLVPPPTFAVPLFPVLTQLVVQPNVKRIDPRNNEAVPLIVTFCAPDLRRSSVQARAYERSRLGHIAVMYAQKRHAHATRALSVGGVVVPDH